MQALGRCDIAAPLIESTEVCFLFDREQFQIVGCPAWLEAAAGRCPHAGFYSSYIGGRRDLDGGVAFTATAPAESITVCQEKP